MRNATAAAIADVELSRIAASKAVSGDVRGFAQRIVDDHKSMNDRLATLARDKRLPVATAVDAEQKKGAERVLAESGSDFDRAYIERMVLEHRRAVDFFERAAQQKSLDHDLRYFAEKAVPALKQHQDTAEELQAQLSIAATQSRR